MAHSDDRLPQLGETLRDRVTTLGKGALGTIPVVGSILAEIVGTLIPNQRLQRIEAYLAHLSERLEAFGTEDLHEKMSKPDAVDLFEEGAIQSTRALSDERKAQIANIVANGLAGDAKERIEAKRLLKLLAEIDDDQLVILASHLRKNWNNAEFTNKHRGVLEPIRVSMRDPDDKRDAATLYELARSELGRLGLLRNSFPTLKKGEFPEFDSRTGMIKARSREISQLGRLLLVRAGIADPGDL